MLLLVLAACGGPYSAPYGASVTLQPEAITMEFGGDFYDMDGIGAASYAFAYVTGPDTRSTSADDIPLNNVQVTLTSGWAGAYLLPPEAVKAAGTLEDSCAQDSSQDECSIFYDNTTGSSYEVSGEYAYVEDLRPNVLYAQTDNTGLAPFWIFFDSLPYSDSDTSFDIEASMNEQMQTLSITVQEPTNG